MATKKNKKSTVKKASKKTAPAKKSAKKVSKKVTKKAAPKAKASARKKSTAKVSFIPKGYHTATPYLIIRNAAAAIDFYKAAFGAKEIGRLTMSGDKVVHCEIQIGDSKLMLADEFPEWGGTSPELLNGTPVGLCLYVKDVDSFFAKAIAAGGKEMRPVSDQFYGDRAGTLHDPFGHRWTICTHKENVSFKEMQKRSDAAFSQAAEPAAN